jgi:hypothetical protein
MEFFATKGTEGMKIKTKRNCLAGDRHARACPHGTDHHKIFLR